MNEKLRSTMAALVAGVSVFGALRWVRNRGQNPEPDDPGQMSLVDEAGEESFPASDPPSWTLGEDNFR